jgi:hypothetical protein
MDVKRYHKLAVIPRYTYPEQTPTSPAHLESAEESDAVQT